MKRKASISAKVIRAIIDDAKAFSERLASRDPAAVAEVKRRFKIAAKDPRRAADLDVIDELSPEQIEAVGRLFLPAKRGRTIKSDQKLIDEGKERIAKGEHRGDVIADLASRCDAPMIESAKRRLRRKLPPSKTDKSKK